MSPPASYAASSNNGGSPASNASQRVSSTSGGVRERPHASSRSATTMRLVMRLASGAEVAVDGAGAGGLAAVGAAGPLNHYASTVRPGRGDLQAGDASGAPGADKGFGDEQSQDGPVQLHRQRRVWQQA